MSLILPKKTVSEIIAGKHKPQKQYGPLEIQGEEQRKDAHDAIQKLLNSLNTRAICLPLTACAQKELVMTVAHLLLGSEEDFEELC
jgi:hypothetical protein